MKPYTVKILLIFMALLWPGMAAHATRTAAEAYDAGDYDAAIRLWEQERDSSGVSSGLFYNLGNAYSKIGDQGAAVLNYEKALRMDPSNKQARANLRYTDNMVQIANETLTDGKNMDPTPADSGFFDNIGNLVSRLASDTWAIWGAVMFMLSIGSCAAYLFVPNVTVRKFGFFGGAVLLLLCMACVWGAVVSKRHALSTDVCVLMADEASLMLDPGAASKTVGTPLSAGTRLKVMGTDKDSDGGEWVQVYLNAEYSGWLPVSDVAIVSVPQLVE